MEKTESYGWEKCSNVDKRCSCCHPQKRKLDLALREEHPEQSSASGDLCSKWYSEPRSESFEWPAPVFSDASGASDLEKVGLEGGAMLTMVLGFRLF
jgi:hypothetical protein